MTAPFATALLGWKASGKNKLGWPLVPNFADVDSTDSLRIAAGVLDELKVQREQASVVPRDPGGPLEDAVADRHPVPPQPDGRDLVPHAQVGGLRHGQLPDRRLVQRQPGCSADRCRCSPPTIANSGCRPLSQAREATPTL
jgi:hypothetical protein